MHATPETAASSSAGAVLEEDAAQAVALYRHMVVLRLVSARMVDLQRTEKVAFHSASLGEEAVIAATALAARPNDWVFPGVREWGAAIVRGLPIVDYMHHAFGSSKDAAKGHSAPDHPPAKRFRVAPASGVVGAHIPQAVGAAWAAKIRKDDVAALALFGEAATSTGDFHNALNFAGVFKPAVVLVCRNDGREPFATKRERAIAYGVATATVDGSDALAVLALVRAALARALAGKGATLVEAVTQPLGGAVTVLPGEAWKRGTPELLAISESDPLLRLRRTLERDKLLDAAATDTFAREARAAIDAAVTDAERAGPPAASTIFDDVLAEMPPHLLAQKESAAWRR